jgi:hypothetical protein
VACLVAFAASNQSIFPAFLILVVNSNRTFETMLRPARYSDHNTLATLCSAAFFDEDLFGRTMHPHRNEFPDDVALYWLQHIRTSWCDWRNRAIVAVTHDQKTGQETIVGLAIWQRQGEGGKKMALSSVDPRESLSYLSDLDRLVMPLLTPTSTIVIYLHISLPTLD